MPATLQAPAGFSDAMLGDNASLPAGNVRESGDWPEDEFVTIANVPVFAEHETVGNNGRPLQFGFAELKAVCDRSNARIAESGDYAAVTIGHTPSPEAKDKGAPDPEVVGFAGPFRMGTVGTEGVRKRYAILADFHIYRSDYEKLRKHPRRSPELWLEDRYEDMFLDPIALLGAECPRLDLGMLYSAQRHGVRIEKYSATFGGATNTSIPGHETRDYQGEPAMDATNGGVSDVAREVLNALEQSDVFQFVRSQMEQDAGDDTAGGLPGMDAAAPPVEPAADPLPPAGPEPSAPPVDPAGPPAAGPPAVPAGPSDEEKEVYAALDEVDDDMLNKYMSHRKKRRYSSEPAEGYTTDTNTGCKAYEANGSVDDDGKLAAGNVGDNAVASDGDADTDGEQGNRVTENYNRVAIGEKLKYELKQRDNQIGQLQKTVNTLKYQAANSERKSVVLDLQSRGWPVDVDKMMERVNYSKMNDEQFTNYVSLYCETVPPAPINSNLPFDPSAQFLSSDMPGTTREREKYSRAATLRAREITERKVAAGEDADYKAVLEEVYAGKHGEVVSA